MYALIFLDRILVKVKKCENTLLVMHYTWKKKVPLAVNIEGLLEGGCRVIIWKARPRIMTSAMLLLRYVDLEKELVHALATTRNTFSIPTQFSIPFQWQ